jgi:hypothetical protein
MVKDHITTPDAPLRNPTTAVWASANAGSYVPMLERRARTRTIRAHSGGEKNGEGTPF